MANRCNLTEHGDCAICKDFVGPWSGYHIHTAPWRNKPAAVVCTNCYGIILTASQFILRALQDGGFEWNSQETLREVLATRVVLGLQQGLNLN
jgi:hypothetical protein